MSDIGRCGCDKESEMNQEVKFGDGKEARIFRNTTNEIIKSELAKQLGTAPLDIREKIAETIETLYPDALMLDTLRIADQILDFVQPLIDHAREEGKAECAKTHFKPDWEIKAKDVKAAMEEGYEAGMKEGRAEMISKAYTLGILCSREEAIEDNCPACKRFYEEEDK